MSRQFQQSLRIPAYMLLVLFAVHLFQVFFGLRLSNWGVFPRAGWSISGILTSPLVHGSWSHLLSNSFPLFVSTAIIFFFYKKVAIRAFLFTYLLAGIFLWAFGDLLFDQQRNVHIGASGVVYGLVAFIFWTGIFRRNFKSIVLALVVLVLFQGMFAGISPALEVERISWEGHLYGALAGILVAWLLRDEIEPDEKHRYSYEDEPESEKQWFLDRDVFDKSKKERNQDQSPFDSTW